MTIHRNTARALVALLISATTLATSAEADMVKDFGKAGSWSSTSGLALTTSPAVLGSVSIQKGKKKRALEIEATLIETTNVATGLNLQAVVNGMPLEPTTVAQSAEGCGPTILNCTAQGVWWIDLDQAELLVPGAFIGVPLGVTIFGNSTGSPATGRLSIRARLVRP